jgi:hypothetical protein
MKMNNEMCFRHFDNGWHVHLILHFHNGKPSLLHSYNQNLLVPRRGQTSLTTPSKDRIDISTLMPAAEQGKNLWFSLTSQ